MRMRSFQTLSRVSLLAVAFAIPAEAQSVQLCPELPSPRSVDTLPLHLGLMVRTRGDQLQQRYSAKERAALSSLADALKPTLAAIPVAATATVRSRFMQVTPGAKRFTPVIPGNVTFTLDESGNIADLRVPERDGSVEWVQTLVGAAAMPVYDGTLAVLRPGAEAVRYPRALREAGKQGNVLTQAIISATGQVERASLTILRADEPEFAEEVRSWMLRTTFKPATIGGCAVRSLVQMPTGFTLRR